MASRIERFTDDHLQRRIASHQAALQDILAGMTVLQRDTVAWQTLNLKQVEITVELGRLEFDLLARQDSARSISPYSPYVADAQQLVAWLDAANARMGALCSDSIAGHLTRKSSATEAESLLRRFWHAVEDRYYDYSEHGIGTSIRSTDAFTDLGQARQEIRQDEPNWGEVFSFLIRAAKRASLCLYVMENAESAPLAVDEQV